MRARHAVSVGHYQGKILWMLLTPTIRAVTVYAALLNSPASCGPTRLDGRRSERSESEGGYGCLVSHQHGVRELVRSQVKEGADEEGNVEAGKGSGGQVRPVQKQSRPVTGSTSSHGHAVMIVHQSAGDLGRARMHSARGEIEQDARKVERALAQDERGERHELVLLAVARPCLRDDDDDDD